MEEKRWWLVTGDATSKHKPPGRAGKLCSCESDFKTTVEIETPRKVMFVCYPQKQRFFKAFFSVTLCYGHGLEPATSVRFLHSLWYKPYLASDSRHRYSRQSLQKQFIVVVLGCTHNNLSRTGLHFTSSLCLNRLRCFKQWWRPGLTLACHWRLSIPLTLSVV